MKLFFQHGYLNLFSFLGLAIIAILSVIFLFQVKHLNNANTWVMHTQNNIETGYEIQKNIISLEANLRAYLLTGDEEQLKNFANASDAIYSNINKMKTSLQDNPLQISRLNSLQHLFDRRISTYHFVINMRKTQGLNETLDFFKKNVLLTASFKLLARATNDTAKDIVNAEKNLLSTRSQKLLLNMSLVTTLGTIGIGVSLSVILLCVILLNRQLLIRSQTENKLAVSQRQLEKLAYFDPLTGLHTRFKFLESIKNITSNSQKIALFYLDLDNFKNINDNFGHAVGDALLQKISQRLQAINYADKFISRISGDEFVILFFHIAENDEISMIAQGLLDSIIAPIHILDHKIICTASIGISIYPHSADNGEDLVKNADIAMYKAKQLGKNNYQFGTRQMSREVEERAKLSHHLYQAVQNKEFVILYQPKLSLKTNQPSGMEALIRWDRPNIGIINPIDFISLAENNGLINPIGEWMLETVCTQIKSWQKSGFEVPNVAINVSMREFIMRDFSHIVKKILDETNLAPHHLEIEITETILMEKSSNNIAALSHLKSLGVQITIDDFGTGYSSLSYLNLFPISKLKIDKSFVAQIKPGAPDPAIIVAIISMAHSLGIKVVAEGVETNMQLDFLAQHHCDEIQGYHYSRPLAPDDVHPFFANYHSVNILNQDVSKNPWGNG